jgi:hypothetical protein
MVQGLTALLDDTYFVVRNEDQLLITGFQTWGWVLVIWSIAQIAAAFGLNGGHGWARVLAVAIASISILIQIAFLAAFPLWSMTIIALDVIVLFALVVRWDEARAGL